MAELLQRARALLPPLEGGLEDLLLPLYQGIVIVALRVATEKLLVPPLRRYLKHAPSSESAKSPERRAHEVVDNAFLVAVIAPLSLWGCVRVRIQYLSRMHFFAHTAEMLGTALGGVGFKLNLEMVIHHLVTMVLMLFGYYGGLHRYGMMATTVLDSSNTLLHAAKAVHATGLPQLVPLQDALFKLFALVFFVVRVVMPPPTMLYPGITHGRVLPTRMYYVTNGLMFVIYGLQIMWFYKIVRIAMGGDSKPAKKAAPAAVKAD
ncbi:hypothetical protein MNEG_4442 [Monoraphidium neglectum]|uniref:TLC domain-containing protein n=1 Tax=Monoraphidium neglectum TaxID=145388 RepID=A0A0D2MSV3_9CHLO|nr:hypothetical protein MNEG_4442 [Monoraphidium neglectum]KIZ03512.1 hypothetical protein MNEG_4442 [Monoraphidium neglectum]|eukprot:XP_013902531.1 hypothetical protein MNEG_4442 [Monoraphidium neglectum]